MRLVCRPYVKCNCFGERSTLARAPLTRVGQRFVPRARTEGCAFWDVWAHGPMGEVLRQPPPACVCAVRLTRPRPRWHPANSGSQAAHPTIRNAGRAGRAAHVPADNTRQQLAAADDGDQMWSPGSPVAARLRAESALRRFPAPARRLPPPAHRSRFSLDNTIVIRLTLIPCFAASRHDLPRDGPLPGQERRT